MQDQPRVDPARQQEAKRYARTRRALLIVDLGIVAVLFLGLLTTGASEELRNLAVLASGSLIVVVAIYFVVLYSAYAVVTLPVSLYGDFSVPHRFGLSNQSLAEWFGDWFKSTGLGLAMGLVLVEALYVLLTNYPDTWWVPASVGLVIFNVVLANLAPVILVPIFYRLQPLADQELVERLVRLAERTGTRVRGVYTMNLSSKTPAANAALMGLGNTRRIVLGDTLIDSFTPDEIETVMAHELGHHVHADIPKLIAVESATTFVGLYVAGLVLRWATVAFQFSSVADVAALPLLALTLGAIGTLSMPLTNSFSRWIERQADHYALEVTEKPRAFAGAMIRLANQNLAELHPARWVEVLLYDHPPVGERIETANAFARRRGTD